MTLINKIKNDISQNIIPNNSLFVGNNNDSHNYILADINKSKNNIYTKLYKINNNNFDTIDINSVPLNFRAIITIRIKSLLEKDDIYQIIIKDEIILDKNKDGPDDLDIINDFL